MSQLARRARRDIIVRRHLSLIHITVLFRDARRVIHLGVNYIPRVRLVQMQQQIAMLNWLQKFIWPVHPAPAQQRARRDIIAQVVISITAVVPQTKDVVVARAQPILRRGQVLVLMLELGILQLAVIPVEITAQVGRNVAVQHTAKEVFRRIAHRQKQIGHKEPAQVGAQ